MKLNKMIDHTILKANVGLDQVDRVCREALEYDFASVCVNTCHVEFVAKALKESQVKTCVVVGFPLGAMMTEAKAFEARLAVEKGADEVDMVLNIGALKDGNIELVEADIAAVVEASKPALVKVILETCLLTDQEKVAACQASVRAGAGFVKTSTGFSTGGATVEDIALMRKTVGPDLGVKASGGVRTKEDAEKMIAAGASRIGASASIAIVEGIQTESKGY
jgi:deoxyribose-phosphate aldolase